MRRKFTGPSIHRVRDARVIDQSRVTQAEPALRCDKPHTAISKTIDETLQRHHRLHAQLIGRAQMAFREGCTLSSATIVTGAGISNSMSYPKRRIMAALDAKTSRDGQKISRLPTLDF